MSENRPRPSIVVGIPVKNEADRIAHCLRALYVQKEVSDHRIAIVLFLNNCTDRTAFVVQQVVAASAVPVHVLEMTLPQEFANAGYARHLVMKRAEELVDDHGILLTTDADACVEPDWLALNLRELGRGADAVAGRIELDPSDAALIPAKLHEDDARECLYANLLDRINAVLDPDPVDPWPRHSEHSGASIAVTVSAYRRAGGIPNVSLGEDRAFFAALRRVDARIRHAPEVRVVVSGRTIGRAVGGMADTIRRRMIRPDETIDDRLEPAEDAARRYRLRQLARTAHSRRDELGAASMALAEVLRLPCAEVIRALSLSPFGAAWTELEKTSLALIKRDVAVRDLENQTLLARSILNDALNRLNGKASEFITGSSALPDFQDEVPGLAN